DLAGDLGIVVQLQDRGSDPGNDGDQRDDQSDGHSELVRLHATGAHTAESYPTGGARRESLGGGRPPDGGPAPLAGGLGLSRTPSNRARAPGTRAPRASCG